MAGTTPVHSTKIVSSCCASAIRSARGSCDFFDSLGYAGLGVVIRDSTEQIIAALSQKIGLPHSVETTEALAALRTVVFAKELSVFKVIVEGDCLKVVQALKARECCYGTVIEDARL